MEQPKIDVAVLLLFFLRTEKTVKVFDEIRKARPTKLFLYQDGPRSSHPDDKAKLEECRNAIESMIDWECEVHRWYQEENKGCDPSEYLSQKWMFSFVDKGIVLEDDDVPSQSFFPFCKELLDRYEHDTRINAICGMNNLGETDVKESYLFTRYGAIWGWASWRRVIDQWDPQYTWMSDERIKENIGMKWKKSNEFLQLCKRHLASGREHYESILGANVRVNHTLNIVPAKNMITNIGIGEETTHSVNDIHKLPRAVRKVLYMKRHEIEFPLVHPKYVVEDLIWNRDFMKLMGYSPIARFCRKIEGIIYRVFPFLGRL